MTPRFPIFTLCAFLMAALFYFGSIPLWRAHIASEAAARGSTPYLAELSVYIMAFLGGVVGAFIGAVCTIVADVREERFFALRVIALVGNLALVGYGLFVFLVH